MPELIKEGASADMQVVSRTAFPAKNQQMVWLVAVEVFTMSGDLGRDDRCRPS